jgi:UDPglucose 6-dehydrogenase
MKVGVIGVGYVGLTTAVCLAERSHDTVCVDIDVGRVRQLSAGVPPIDEPGLSALLAAGLHDGTLTFRSDLAALADRHVVFVCVPTPSDENGAADLSAVDAVVEGVAQVLPQGAVLAMKSTVPVGTTRRVADRLRNRGVHAVSNPEFLRESHAIYDFRHPDRVLIGADDEAAADTVAAVYGDAARDSAMRMSPESAELAKYASNAFLALKVSYANSLAQLCAQAGADITDVVRCMGADVRIGPHFLQPGPGWGGSCLPKDTSALLHTGRRFGVDLPEVASACATNSRQAARIIGTLRRTMAAPLATARVAALGLTFKAGTCDIRDSPALAVCGELARTGTQITGYDPRLEMIDHEALQRVAVAAVDDPYLAAKDADGIVVFTEWPEFRELNWSRLADQAPGAVVVDTRNLLDPELVTASGLTYLGNGRPSGF